MTSQWKKHPLRSTHFIGEEASVLAFNRCLNVSEEQPTGNCGNRLTQSPGRRLDGEGQGKMGQTS